MHGFDINTLKVGDRVKIEGGGSTQGFVWRTRVKRITTTMVVMENNMRFNRDTRLLVGRSTHNYAQVESVLEEESA